MKGGSDLAACLVAALGFRISGRLLCCSYPACGNLDFSSLMALINRFFAPVVTGLQEQAPFCFEFIIIQSCFQNVAA